MSFEVGTDAEGDCPYCHAKVADHELYGFVSRGIKSVADATDGDFEAEDFNAVTKTCMKVLVRRGGELPDDGEKAALFRLLASDAIAWHWLGHPDEFRPAVADDAAEWFTVDGVDSE